MKKKHSSLILDCEKPTIKNGLETRPALIEDRLMACHGSDNTVELFLVCSDEEVKKRLQKKAKKKRKNKQGVAETTEEIATDEPATLQVWPVAILF